MPLGKQATIIKVTPADIAKRWCFSKNQMVFIAILFKSKVKKTTVYALFIFNSRGK